MEPKCGDCVYFRPYPSSPDNFLGSCHLNPPFMFMLDTDKVVLGPDQVENVTVHTNSHFPQVSYNEFCGQFEPKFEPQGSEAMQQFDQMMADIGGPQGEDPAPEE